MGSVDKGLVQKLHDAGNRLAQLPTDVDELLPLLDVVRCLLIEPFPESALNEQAGKMLLENYAEYARHARLYTGIHALKRKPKFKTGAISESTTALNEIERLGLLCKPVNGEDMTSVADTAGDMATSEGGLEQGRVHTLIFLDQLLGVQLVLRLLEITKLLQMSVTLGV